ncbi:VRR-NUC domain-containing protein [Massilia luteola]|uniref:VRR-NUC domain-containing protein n=1 Tax=Massilia luteola TaxID=3081751 RepID=UPI002ACC2F2B|nr:VRR-NUC domain-containing protein [Massilia sp. Gc5]
MTGPANTPPDGKPPLATGDMSPEGSTTVVPINKPKLDYSDKKVLCSAMCQCQTQPNIGVDGRRLKQECVSGRLKALDATLQHTSPYKAEFTYDMTKRPPEPFLDKEVDTKARTLWPGWTNTLWPKDPSRPPYKAGRGYTRRPDVVIVKDPMKPPTQDNIKQVVEMKFPDDEYRPRQREDYIVIAGDESKMVPLELKDCDCNQREPDKSKVPVEQLGPAAAILGIIYMVVTKRPPPVPAY